MTKYHVVNNRAETAMRQISTGTGEELLRVQSWVFRILSHLIFARSNQSLRYPPFTYGGQSDMNYIWSAEVLL